MWGGLSVAIWILASGRQTLGSLGLLLAVTAWHVGWMQQHTQQPLSRYVLSMGGLVIVQALTMLLIGSPVWQRTQPAPSPSAPDRKASARDSRSPARDSQFGISSLLVLTLLCAASFAAARLYETDDQLFYPGIVVSVGSLVTITLFAQRLIGSPRLTWLWLGGLLSSIAGGGYALSALASVSDILRNQPDSVAHIERTNLILGTFACVVVATTLCGRIDGERGRGSWELGVGRWGDGEIGR